MSEIQQVDDTHIYKIVVRGILDPKWSTWFDDFTIQTQDEQDTVLIGSVRDQGELHGLIARIRDLNLTLLSMEILPGGKSPDPDESPPPITIP